MARDPTKTTTLREHEFRPALTKRFRALKSAIRTTVGYENDALRLRQGSRSDGGAIVRRAARNAPEDIEPADVFRFRSDADRVGQFLDWLEQQIDAGVLEEMSRRRIRNGEHYTARYIRSAADKGWDDAAQQLQQEGIDVEPATLQQTFAAGVPQEQLALLYTRTYENLKSVTDDMAQEIRRQLTQGLAEGWNPRKTAAELNERVDVGISQAERIARTETIHSYNEAALTRFERANVETIQIEAEWTTAGDRRVCPICKTIDGKSFTIEEARTETFRFEAGEDQPPSLSGSYPVKPPAHPNCRCAVRPVVQ